MHRPRHGAIDHHGHQPRHMFGAAHQHGLPISFQLQRPGFVKDWLGLSLRRSFHLLRFEIHHGPVRRAATGTLQKRHHVHPPGIAVIGVDKHLLNAPDPFHVRIKPVPPRLQVFPQFWIRRHLLIERVNLAGIVDRRPEISGFLYLLTHVVNHTPREDIQRLIRHAWQR
ncbi:hypothetical protein SDC9_185455 [bioreactor metagenome]|uniref:Uncharacterized protein n=1 Tax=bioreactor metagenome TaxID=1076179 RepID=A0A645HP83_9ZZZZ